MTLVQFAQSTAQPAHLRKSRDHSGLRGVPAPDQMAPGKLCVLAWRRLYAYRHADLGQHRLLQRSGLVAHSRERSRDRCLSALETLELFRVAILHGFGTA